MHPAEPESKGIFFVCVLYPVAMSVLLNVNQPQGWAESDTEERSTGRARSSRIYSLWECMGSVHTAYLWGISYWC